MKENRLLCCVVRDLLPLYIENLTEEETTAMVKEHLEGCPSCKKTEESMRRRLPLETAPKKAFHFLKKVKRTRLFAAALSAVLALGVCWWLYDQEFHYTDTEAGRLTAVEDYIPSADKSNRKYDVAAGTPLRVLSTANQGKDLYIAYAADTEERIHGLLYLREGINGKYRILNSNRRPFPYTAGVMGTSVPGENGDGFFALIGDGCRDIYSILVTYYVHLEGSEELHAYEKSYTITETEFLWLLELDELEETLGIAEGELSWISDTEITYFDKDGNDVTEQYQDEEVNDNWSGGGGKAELFLLYVYMAIVASLGVLFVLYFLRKE